MAVSTSRDGEVVGRHREQHGKTRTTRTTSELWTPGKLVVDAQLQHAVVESLRGGRSLLTMGSMGLFAVGECSGRAVCSAVADRQYRLSAV